MAQLTVGLDLGNESIKRVRLRSSFRNFEVVDFTRIPVAQDERPYLERLQEALLQLESVSQMDLVATALPGDVVSIRVLSLPFSDRKRIEQTMRFELESQIPFSLDEIVFDYLNAGQTPDGGSRLLVALCQTDRLGDWLDVLREAEIDPRLIGPESLSYSSLLEMLPAAGDEEASIAVLDVGHRLSSLCINGPQGIEFARTLSGGGREVTGQLAETFKVDMDRAEEGKLRGSFVESSRQGASSPEQVVISDAIRRATAALIRELRQTLTAHRSLTQRPLSKIWLCGGGAAIDNFDDYLCEELNVEVERIQAEHFELPGIQSLAEEEDDPGAWAKALGLALQAHQGGRRGWLNLRKGPFAFRGDFEIVRGKVVHVIVALLILVFLAIGQATTHFISLSSTNKVMNKRVKEITQSILGKPYDDLVIAMSIMKEKISPETDPLPRVTAVDVLREIHESIPEEVNLRMKDINISPKRIQVSAFTDSFKSVERIRSSLEDYECFTEIQTGKTQKTADGSEVEFRFTIVFGC